jgi:hypothetical protein
VYENSRNIVLAGVLSGLAVFAALTWAEVELTPFSSWASMLGLGACAGLVLGWLLHGGAAISARVDVVAHRSLWRQPRWLVRAALLWAPFAVANRHSFSGAWIAQRAWAPLLQVGFQLGGFALALAALARVQEARSHPAGRIITGLGAALAGVGAVLLDDKVLVGLYPGLHASLIFAALLCCCAAAWLLLPNITPLFARLLCATALVLGSAAALAIHGNEVLRSQLVGQNPVLLRMLSQLTPSNALDAWRGEEDAARTFLERRLPRIEPHSPLAQQLDSRVPARRAMNVILVSVDTLRADRLRVGGAPQTVMPFVESLAQRSAVFTHAYTSYPTSSPAYSSMFTGRMPSGSPAGIIHRAQKPQWDGLLSLADLLSNAGLRCVAWSAFNAETIAREDIMGHLAAGFSEFTPDRRIVAWDGAELVDRARASVAQLGKQRHFMWLHLLDAHAPYKEREPYFQGGGPEAAYNSELSYVDAQLQLLFADLYASGAQKNTIVVLMGDHGEAFGEHGHRFHATSLYEEQVRVPLIIHVPGLAAMQVPEPVSIMDIFPTLLDLLDIPDNKTREGNSLVPTLMGAARPPGYACAELFASQHTSQGAKRMIVAEGFKLIVDEDLGTTELYDLRQDPAELTNLSSKDPARRNFLLAMLHGLRSDGATHSAIKELDAALTKMHSSDPEERKRSAMHLHQRAVDPLFGLGRGYKDLLQGSMKERALHALQNCIRRGPFEAAIAAFVIGSFVDARGLLSRISDVTPETDGGWQLEYALLRAAAGDQSVIPDLNAALLTDGTPQIPKLALHAVRFGQSVEADILFASIRSPYVFEAAQLLREAITSGYQQDLLPLLLDLQAHPHWNNYAPIRSAAADVLLGTPDTEIARHLLALLARDDDTVVAARALAGLSKIAGSNTRRWLDAADLRLRAHEALVHRDLAAALQRLNAAVDLCPEDSLLQLDFARLEQLQGRQESAGERLRALAQRNDSVAAEAARRLQHGSNVNAWAEEALALEAANFRMPSRALPKTVVLCSLDLTNRSNVALPGGLLPVGTHLRVVLVRENGQTVEDLATTLHIGALDLLPGETRRIHGAFFVPEDQAHFVVRFEGQVALPSGEVRTIPLSGASDCRLSTAID